MSRKDYVLIAAVLKRAIEEAKTLPSPWALVAARNAAGRMATALEGAAGGKFHREKFLSACGIHDSIEQGL